MTTILESLVYRVPAKQCRLNNPQLGRRTVNQWVNSASPRRTAQNHENHYMRGHQFLNFLLRLRNKNLNRKETYTRRFPSPTVHTSLNQKVQHLRMLEHRNLTNKKRTVHSILNNHADKAQRLDSHQHKGWLAQ